MLSYTFKVLQQEQYQEIGKEEFEFIGDMFAEILNLGIASQLKRGLAKEYVYHEETVHGVKGKLNISESIKQLSMINKKMVCGYDDFSEDIPLNQIIKTTVYLLLRSKEISKKNKSNLRKTMLFFNNVTLLEINQINFKGIQINRNNKTYELLINLCYLILKGLIIEEKGYGIKFRKHINDERMASLFERFVLKYYQRHFPSLTPKASHIEWITRYDTDESLTLLPVMKTDIELHGTDQILIVDTKYYTRALSQSQFKETFHSSHIYQIFAYVSTVQLKTNKRVSGMLLYAKTDNEKALDEHLNLNNFDISFKTLDLNLDFKYIKKQLNHIGNSIH